MTEAEERQLVADVDKSWEIENDDGSVVRFTEEDKNALLNEDPRFAGRIRRHVYSDEEKNVLRNRLKDIDFQNLLQSWSGEAETAFPKSMREWQKHENYVEESKERPRPLGEMLTERAKAYGRGLYSGIGDAANFAGRLAYALTDDEKPVAESMKEDYGTTENEGDKSFAWHISRDKFAPLSALLLKKVPAGAMTGRTAAMVGGSAAAAPVAIDLLANKLLDVETIPQTTKESPLASMGTAALLGTAASPFLRAVAPFAAKVAEGSQTLARKGISAAAEKVLRESGALAEIQSLASKAGGESPVQVSAIFNRAKVALDHSALTEKEKKAALEYLDGFRRDVMERTGLKATPSKVAEAQKYTKEARTAQEAKAGYKDEAAAEAKSIPFTAADEAVTKQVEATTARQTARAPLARVNEWLKPKGVKLSQKELDAILTLKPEDLDKTAYTKLQQFAAAWGAPTLEAAVSIIARAAGADDVAGSASDGFADTLLNLGSPKADATRVGTPKE
jgi:hypothetical protein